MENVRGKFGFINLTGQNGAPSQMTTPLDPEFWKFIEDGIKPLVRALLETGIETFGSCQGHALPNGEILFANVRYFADASSYQHLHDAATSFGDPNIIIEKAKPIEGRDTDRILICYNPGNRLDLDKVIEEFSKYFAHLYLVKYSPKADLTQLALNITQVEICQTLTSGCPGSRHPFETMPGIPPGN